MSRQHPFVSLQMGGLASVHCISDRWKEVADVGVIIFKSVESGGGGLWSVECLGERTVTALRPEEFSFGERQRRGG